MSEVDTVWFYRTVDGDEYGPYTQQELKLYASQGRVVDSGFLRREHEENWLPAGLIIQELGLQAPRAMNPPLSLDGLSTGGDSPTSRVAYVLLGLLPAVLLSFFGIHNLIAGYVGKGIAQLLMTVLGIYGMSCIGVAFPPTLCIAAPLWVALMIWVIVEVCTVRVDAMGRIMR